MVSLFIVICLSFVGLGLPDSLIGSSWPKVMGDIGASLSSAGIISFIVCFGTIVSSVFSARVINRFGTWRVTFVSILTTSLAIFGYSFSPSLVWFCVLALPLGLGAGSVDAALNNYVALHYKARHMSWLHSFWGIGATLGPVVLSLFLGVHGGWISGYRTIASCLAAIALIVFFSKPLWAKQEQNDSQKLDTDEPMVISNREAFKLPGIKYALITFVCYCALELTTGLWSSSYLVHIRGLDAAVAASWVSIYYGGITAGRMLSGFVMAKLTSKQMIRIGQCVLALGLLIYVLPLPDFCSMIALLLIGLGCAPIYPCMIHETPHRFGANASQAAIGLQMAAAYVGSTLMPPIFGFIGEHISLSLLPWYLIFFLVLMVFASERINAFTKRRDAEKQAG